MKSTGIDLGSRSVKLVIVEDGRLLDARCADTGYDPLAAARRLMDGVRCDATLATGYGRNLFEVAFDTPTVTEIKAHARGARFLFPQSRTVLDIGGQDSKAIAMAENGRVMKFEMNDRCAAGTGKFLEIMAKALGYELDQFGAGAQNASKDIRINSMCTVFAESEVTSLVARGEDRDEIAMGLHRSVARRATAMLNRVAPDGPLVFSGGVARNTCMARLIGEMTGRKVWLPDDPQLVGALGAALLAEETLAAEQPA